MSMWYGGNSSSGIMISLPYDFCAATVFSGVRCTYREGEGEGEAEAEAEAEAEGE